MFDAFRRWRENYYVSRALSSVGKPVARTCLAVGRGLRTHVVRNGVGFQLPNGRVLRIGPDSGIAMSSALYWGGLDAFEPSTSRTLRFFFSRVANFVDVGANYGFYSLLAAHWNPNVHVTAFEPVPQIFARLEENIRLNELDGRVQAHCAALSDANGRAKLYVPTSAGRDCESTATLAEESWQQRKGSPSIEVQAVSFDEFERQHAI